MFVVHLLHIFFILLIYSIAIAIDNNITDGIDNIMYFSLCLMAKATQSYEHYDIREFIEYHLRLGTSVIYIYDDNSPVPFNVTLQDYIKTGAVYYTFIGMKLCIVPYILIFNNSLLTAQYQMKLKVKGKHNIECMICVLKITCINILGWDSLIWMSLLLSSSVLELKILTQVN